MGSSGVSYGLMQQSIGLSLRNQGYSLINNTCYQPAASGNSQTLSAPYNGQTLAVSEVSPYTVPKVRMVYCNTFGQSSSTPGELPFYSDFYCQASLRNAYNGICYPVTFNGQLEWMATSAKVLISDDVYFPVTAQTPYLSVTYAGLTGIGGSSFMPNGIYLQNTYQNPSTIEGYWSENAAFYTAAAPTATSSTGGFSHTGIMGYTGSKPQASIAFIGDSRIMGNGCVASARLTSGGTWADRFCQGQYGNQAVVYPGNSPAPLCGFLNLAKSGDTLANFVTAGQHELRLQLASLASTVVSDFGINDIGSGSLSTMQANFKTLVGLVWNLGVNRFIQCTLYPRPQNSNGNWTIITNQTQNANQTTYAGFNNWLRDTSASGAVAQCQALYGFPTNWFQVYDQAAVLEVNSSNVLTQNGGLFLAPSPTYTYDYSGSVTSASGNAQVFTDTGLGSTGNQYRGGTILWTSGNNANTMTNFSWCSPAGVVQTPGSTSNPANGDTYQVWMHGTTTDGVHGSDYAAKLLATDFYNNVWNKGLII
jgi:hypothetical protein